MFFAKPASYPALRGQPHSARQNRKEAIEEIDFVLRECHGLARDALYEDTS